MNLLEVLMAAVLFVLSAGSSLQIWNLISSGEMQHQQRQRLADRLDVELAAVEGLLRQQARQVQALPACGQGAAPLALLIGTRPVHEGIVRRITPLDLEDGLLLELAVEGSPLRRRRLYRPAALGLCLPASPPLTPAPARPPLPEAGGSHALS